MLSRWSRSASVIWQLGALQRVVVPEELHLFGRSHSQVPTAAAPASYPDSVLRQPSSKPEVAISGVFAVSFVDAELVDSREPTCVGRPSRGSGEKSTRSSLHSCVSRADQSEEQMLSIRGSSCRLINPLSMMKAYNYPRYRVIQKVQKVFNLEKTFKTTFSMLVLHMWLFLRRLKEEGKEGSEFGQHLYEIYNHDLEMRVSKAGPSKVMERKTSERCAGNRDGFQNRRSVNLLLIKWMKELEKIFYGNIVVYDDAMKPDAKHDELTNAIWR
ncbi:hypothetical protein KSP40_PGU000615 [Platanthera guangdongensis]|uniref:Ubiquinol-cytochrome c chaperone domain-containing protein n=1 Tax=Platanthera guangdongensis TaxID=2320717 RepID=A0ABR2LK94_9ASPA